MEDESLDVKGEVSEMLKAFGEQIDEPKVEDKVEDKETTSTTAPSTVAPSTESPSTESPTTDAPEEDEKDKLIRELREKLAEKEKVKEPEPKQEPEPEPKKPEPISFEDQDFINDLDLDDLSRDPKEFNKLLNTVYKKAITDTRNLLAENILRAIPEIVRANVTVMNNLKEASDEFYKNNQDLKSFKKVVATVFEEIASDNPGKPFETLFPMVADEARKRLDLHKQAIGPQATKPPKLPSRKGRVQIPQETPNPNPLLSELDEMNKIVRR
jgi:hypothetical protein